MESKFKQLPIKPQLVLSKDKLLNKSPSSSSITYQTNSTHLVVGIGNANPNSSALSSKRPKDTTTGLSSSGLRIF
jgi:hypothetical protein